MKNQQIAGTGILLAISIILGFISNYIQFGTISINLTLIPIVLSSICFGLESSIILGFISGIIILFAPSTAFFLSLNPLAAVFICLFKGILVGIISYILFYLIKPKNTLLSILLPSFLAPFINTGFFILCTLLFFKNNVGNIISIIISFNFLFEFLITALITPPLAKIINRKLKETNKLEN